MLRAGVIGDPVTHSYSPTLHNAAFAHLGIAARYERWPASVDELPARVDSLRAPHMLGANVTLPHKVRVVPLLDQVEPQVELIGALNTIVRMDDGSLLGANTDSPAFLSSLREEGGYDPAGQSAALLGASGAARAAAVALVAAGVVQLVVVNRTLDRAEDLLGDLLAGLEADARLFALTPGDPQIRELLAESTLVVNATSLGWHADETPLPADLIPPDALVFDMVYRRTRLLREAAARGARTLDGRGMLVRQAALSFERWTRRPAPFEIMRAALEEAL